ncbi:MAG: hypothetical protein V4492_00190 [Chlamydiota bacterium]
MAPRLRRMRPYHPRKRSKKGPSLIKQALKHQIDSDVGTIIVQYEQGNIDALSSAQLKAKSDFQKHSDEMQKLAQKLGDNCVNAVKEFLNSAETLIHTSSTWIDDAKIRTCYATRKKLESELGVAA